MDIKAVVDEEKSPLSHKENESYELMVSGYGRKQIAAELERSEDTIKAHMTSIYKKLGVHKDTQAIAVGIIRGFIRYQNNMVVGVLVGLTAFYGVLPNEAYAHALVPIQTESAQSGEEERENPFVRLRVRPSRQQRRSSRGRRLRSKHSRQEMEFAIAER